MAMFCRYCRSRMTSAPSHMDHERECSKNPENEVVSVRMHCGEARDMLDGLVASRVLDKQMTNDLAAVRRKLAAAMGEAPPWWSRSTR